MADVDLVPLNETYRDAIAAGRELTQNMKNWNGVIQNDGQLGDAAAADTLSQIAVGDAAAFRQATGTEFRSTGWGVNNNSTNIPGDDANTLSMSGVFRCTSSTAGMPDNNLWQLISSVQSANVAFQLAQRVTGSAAIYYRSRNTAGTWTGWSMVLSNSNTTADSNGFIKAASPIFRLANVAEDASGDGFTLDGCGAYNGEAHGVTASHDDVGVYTVSGSLGFAVDGWTIEIPQDVNGNRLCFVETETADDGTITVRTFGRRFDYETAMIVAGDPIDIPDGRWIDLRLAMPASEQPQLESSDAGAVEGDAATTA